MNPAAFSSHAGAMAPGQGVQMANQHQPEIGLISKRVLQMIQAQGTFTGWRESVPMQDRLKNIHVLLSSLRLAQTKDSLPVMIDNAVGLEAKAFRESADRNSYDKQCQERLSQLRDSRQQRIAKFSMTPQQQAGALPPNAQGQLQAGFQNQFRPMPTPHMQMSQQQQQLQFQLQQQQQQQQQQQGMALNLQNPQMHMRNQAFVQNGQQRPAPVPGSQDFNSLTQAELMNVYHLADQMWQHASPADLEKVNMIASNMPPEQRQGISQKGMSPVQYIYRVQALKEFRKHRALKASQAMNANSGNRAMNDPMAGGAERAANQTMMGQPGGVDAGIASSLDHLQGQQADGLRSQEAGQLVVPATAGHMVGQQFGNQQRLPQNGQPNMGRPGVNPALLAQQQQQRQHQQLQQHQRQALHNAQQEKMQQAQLQAQAQAHAHKAQMGMPSQQTPQVTHPISQSPAMPLINRPLGPQQMSPPQPGSQSSLPRTASVGNEQGSAQTTHPGMHHGIPPGLPPGVQAQLANMTQEQIAMLLQRQNTIQQRPNAAIGMQQPRPTESDPATQQPNSQMMDPGMRSLMQQQQQRQNLAGMGGGPPRAQPAQGQNQLGVLQQRHQQHQDAARMQFLRQQSGSVEMTEDQIKEMDRLAFPPAILNSTSNLTASLPKNVKTWGQLKFWASQNPQLTRDVTLPKLQMLQKYHFLNFLANREASRARTGPPQPGVMQNQIPPYILNQGQQRGQLLSIGQQHQQPPPPPPQQQQQQQPLQNIPAIRPITANDISLARQNYGARIQHMSDDALRQALEKQAMKRMQEQAAAAGSVSGQPLGPQSYPQQQQTQPMGTQPPQRPPQSTQIQNASLDVNKAAGQIAPTPVRVTNKQTSRGTKRPSGPEVVETTQQAVAAVQASNQAQHQQQLQQQQQAQHQLQQLQYHQQMQQQQQKSGLPQPSNPAAMAAQQKAQSNAQMQRQPSQPRQPISKATAEEAWSRVLPENLRQMYAEYARTEMSTPVNITPAQRAVMAQQLLSSIDLISHMEALVMWISRMPDQDKLIAQLLRMRLALMKQFKDPEWTLVDHFTIAPDTLSSAVHGLRRYFSKMISVSKQANTAAATAKAAPPQAPQQPSMVPLNASNLQQLEQQQAEIQRAKRARTQTVPPAPTTIQPPFPLGATSPQGVPHAYGPPNLTPDRLTLPPPKKLKRGPTTQKDEAKQHQEQDRKPILVEAGKPAEKPTQLFKCSVPECEYHIRSLPSQAALDKHTAEQHDEEVITNPLEFFIESLRTGLGLDKQKPNTTEVEEQRQRQDGQQQTRMLAATPATVQMTHSMSGAGAAKSPASNLAKTPVSNALKRPSSSQLKAAPSEMSAKNVLKQESPPRALKDPWEDSPISWEEIRSAWSDILAPDPVDELLRSESFACEAFANIQTKDTPQSTDTSANAQTPQDSDISKDDDLEQLADGTGEGGMRAEWVQLPGALQEALLMTESWDDADWMMVDDEPTPEFEMPYSI